MFERMIRNWVYGAAAFSLVLLALFPLLLRGESAAVRAAFLLLPVYMLHQWEEHDNDRFRRFVNELLGGAAKR